MAVLMICALESLPSISRMRPSTKLCFSLAASYSAFSERSPCARASEIFVFQALQFGFQRFRARNG
jgi:hypothetical protein